MSDASATIESLVPEGQALVHSLALRVHRELPVLVELDDLIAYGQVGLLEAAREFDPQLECQFTTFAYHRVRGAIYDGVSKMSWTSRARWRKLRYARMAEAVLADENERRGSASCGVEESARRFGDVVERLSVVYLASHGGAGSGDGSEEFVDEALTAPVRVETLEICERLRTLVDQLPAVEGNLIRAVYFEGHTLQEAAERSGISKSWASRLHAKVLEDLGRAIRRIGGD